MASTSDILHYGVIDLEVRMLSVNSFWTTDSNSEGVRNNIRIFQFDMPFIPESRSIRFSAVTKYKLYLGE